MSDREMAAALALGAVTLVRRLRGADRAARLSGPQASALGVIRYVGSIRMSRLAEIEEVGRPAITKTVAQLEALGLVVRKPDEADGRAALVSATAEGERLFEEGHARRTAPLAAAIAELSDPDRETLAAGIRLMHRLGEAVRQAEDA